MNDLKSGYGVNVCYEGRVEYDGYWKYDDYEGQGTLKWFSHEFIGNWKNSSKEGAGTYIAPDGDTLKGIWKDDAYQQLVKKDVYEDSRDGKEYDIVIIGNQTWFAENIAYEPEDAELYKHPEDSNQIAYNWETVNTVCPSGWHLPTVVESDILEVVCGYDAEVNLKSSNGWVNDGNGNDSYGFNILPFGVKTEYSDKGDFNDYGSETCFWLVDTEDGSGDSRIWNLTAKDYSLKLDTKYSIFNFARCLKD